MQKSTSLWGIVLLLCLLNQASAVIITSGNLTCDFAPYLTPFVDALELPTSANIVGGKYTLNISQTDGHQFHRDLPPTTLWTYNGVFPGPTFDIQKGTALHVTVINNLPLNTPLLPIQDVMNTGAAVGDRTVVHLHGGLNKPQYCGHPLDYVRPYKGHNIYTNYYANNQPAANLWYHDHAWGLTTPNVYAGLAGAYFIRDSKEASLGLPQGNFEIPLVLSAKEFNLTTGQLYLPFARAAPLIPNYNLVNNKVWPYLEVSQNRYRFRMLNAANHRVFHLYAVPDVNFHIIGADDGFLDQTATTNNFIIATGERYDVIIDFEDFPIGTNIIIMNNANDPFSNGTTPAPGVPPPCPAHFVMEFRVTKGPQFQLFRNIPSIITYPPFNYNSPQIAQARHRNFTISQPFAPEFLAEGKLFLSRLSPYVPLGSSEVWMFMNVHPRIAHPLHIHLVNFRVLGRQYVFFNNSHLVNQSDINYGLPMQPNMIIDRPGFPEFSPESWERGQKDTAINYPNSILWLYIEDFGPYVGEYVYHCHMLDHEEYDLMQRWAVTPVGPDCEQDADEWDTC